jgi:hypothetical protein
MSAQYGHQKEALKLEAGEKFVRKRVSAINVMQNKQAI